MNRHGDELFDLRVADWLESDPELAPAQVLETVRAALPSVPQRRASRIPWWTWSLAVRFGLGTAAIVIGIVLGVSLLGSPTGDVGGAPTPSQSPSPSPTLTPTNAPPTGIPTSGLTTFTSAMYGYSISYPQEWVVRTATRELSGTEPPWDTSPAIDHFATSTDRYGEPQGGPLGRLIVASVAVGSEVTLESWTADTTEAVCGFPTSREAVDVDGEPANLLTYSLCYSTFHQWVTVLHGGSAFHIVWLGDSGPEAFDRALFEDILATFSFPPDGQVSPTP